MELGKEEVWPQVSEVFLRPFSTDPLRLLIWSTQTERSCCSRATSALVLGKMLCFWVSLCVSLNQDLICNMNKLEQPLLVKGASGKNYLHSFFAFVFFIIISIFGYTSVCVCVI